MKQDSTHLISRRATLLLSGAAALVPSSDVRAAQTASPAWAAAVDGVIAEQMAAKRIPGLTLAVCQNGQLAYARGYGLADLELNVPADPAQLYQSGSTGKMFTATAIMQLLATGRLNLDEPISARLEGTPPHWRGITIDHLMRHRSGIPDYDDRELDVGREWPASEMIAQLASWELDFEPGTRFSYSNSGYVLLGYIIEAAAGRPYWEHLREHVFAPAGMKTAQINDISAILPGRARGYSQNDSDALVRPIHVSDSVSRFGDGSLLYSALDLAAWDQALTQGRILPARLQTLVETAPAFPDGSRPIENYGAGWATRFVRGHRLVAHGGSWQGFSASVARYVDDGLSIMMLCNLERGGPSGFSNRVAGAINPQLAPYDAVTDDNPARTASDRARLAAYLTAGAAPSAPAQQRRAFTEIGTLGEGHRFVLADTSVRGRTYRFGEDDGSFVVHVDRRGRMAFDIAW